MKNFHLTPNRTQHATVAWHLAVAGISLLPGTMQMGEQFKALALCTSFVRSELVVLICEFYWGD